LYGKSIDKSKRYKIIPNAVDTEKYKFDPEVRETVRKELGIEDKFVIGHIGRFVYQKNHDFLIDIFSEVYKRNDNAVLLLIGEGALLDDVKAKVHKLALDDVVYFLGARQDANRLYQAFDVFCLPSRYEGLPVVGVEAQIAGLPCVFSSAITKETKFTDYLTFVDLKQSILDWAEIVLNSTNSGRKTNVNIGMFDISKQTQELECFYEKYKK